MTLILNDIEITYIINNLKHVIYASTTYVQNIMLQFIEKGYIQVKNNSIYVDNDPSTEKIVSELQIVHIKTAIECMSEQTTDLQLKLKLKKIICRGEQYVFDSYSNNFVNPQSYSEASDLAKLFLINTNLNKMDEVLNLYLCGFYQ